MRKSGQAEFETYLKERNRRTKTALTAIEKAGTEAALDRCRALARKSKPISATKSLSTS